MKTVMRLTEVLSKRKLIESKMADIINNDSRGSRGSVHLLLDSVVKSTGKAITSMQQKDVAIEQFKSKAQTYSDLLDNYMKLSRIINEVNAIKTVMIDGEELIIAGALALKNKSFRALDAKFINTIITNVEEHEKRVRAYHDTNLSDDVINDYIGTVTEHMGGEKGCSPDMIRTLRENYIAERELEVVDPNGYIGKLETLVASYNERAEKIDTVLAIANTLITVEVDLDLPFNSNDLWRFVE